MHALGLFPALLVTSHWQANYTLTVTLNLLYKLL
jgi:hypothetical protein